ncbi:tRNA m5C-methyltransferase, putative [Plasmodium sp. gorilla clade G2]|uniref:tRNA m5C-methyltransferase, putative n=1 Tax=Plasmodium sp. gorilla clade G2 TaxID=880535 RepID=UPI000D222738|nr:tRNA m5C-methyltransferase, putative [Plasmodium sp. gorilla clade G2]SOV12792.1 tRNA m5C-methyltransferase, putative [Plasmodium sp. gorilla clade G2]
MENDKQPNYYDNEKALEKNESFFNYYVNQKILKSQEIDNFMEIINKELPITFRVLNNNKYSSFIHENIKKQLENICKDKYSIIKLNEEDHMYEIHLTRSEIKKQENYKNLYNYLINLNESGFIFRQELVSMLPVLFLKLKENFFVLDICAAPGSKTAQILDYMHTINRRKIKNILIKKFLKKNRTTLYKNLYNCNSVDDEDSDNSDDSFELDSYKINDVIKEDKKNDTNKIIMNVQNIMTSQDVLFYENNINVQNILTSQEKTNSVDNLHCDDNMNNDSFKNEDSMHDYNKNICKENIYRTYYNILENNNYDDPFFEYILNVDNNLYNDYKKLISNNNPDGVVVANDSNFKRCCMLFHRLKNIHSDCLVVTNNNAVTFPYIYIKRENTNMENNHNNGFHHNNDYHHNNGYHNKISNDGNILQNENNIFVKKNFDSILCDVPCSGDGTLRKDRNVWINWNANNAYNLFQMQVNILKRSIELTKENGYIVYSTCSLNPIENEAVICEIFNSVENLDCLKLIDFHNELLTKLNYEKAISEWKVVMDDIWFDTYEKYCSYLQNKESGKYKKIYEKIQEGMFPPCEEFINCINLKYAKRFFPHHYNAGGFFIAVIKKGENFQWKSNMKKENKSKMYVDQNERIAFEREEYRRKYKNKKKYNRKIKNNKNNKMDQMNNMKNVNGVKMDDEKIGGESKNENITSNENISKSENITIHQNVPISDIIQKSNDLISDINKKSEELLNNYINNIDDNNIPNDTEASSVPNKRGNNLNFEYTHGYRIKINNEKLVKQQEYVSLSYYEKLICVNNFLEKIKNYFNLNMNFLSIKNNLYIHLQDNGNAYKLSVNERINSNVKKIYLVSNSAKEILESYTKMKLKIITAGITVIQVDKNKKNTYENYYRINYSGCLNFIPFFQDIDNFFKNKKYRKQIIENYFCTVYENKERHFNFEKYMNQLIDERKKTNLSKLDSNKNKGQQISTNEIKNEIDNKENNMSKESDENKNEYIENDINFEYNNDITCDGLDNVMDIPNDNITNKNITYNNITYNNITNVIWVKSDVILDLIKVDKSKINNISNETIKQTEMLAKYSPNILLTLNKNKQILAVPSNKGNMYVDISIDKNSIMMLPYILN